MDTSEVNVQIKMAKNIGGKFGDFCDGKLESFITLREEPKNCSLETQSRIKHRPFTKQLEMHRLRFVGQFLTYMRIDHHFRLLNEASSKDREVSCFNTHFKFNFYFS